MSLTRSLRRRQVDLFASQRSDEETHRITLQYPILVSDRPDNGNRRQHPGHPNANSLSSSIDHLTAPREWSARALGCLIFDNVAGATSHCS